MLGTKPKRSLKKAKGGKLSGSRSTAWRCRFGSSWGRPEGNPSPGAAVCGAVAAGEGIAFLEVRLDPQAFGKSAEELREAGHQHRFQDRLVREAVPTQLVHVLPADPGGELAQLHCEVEETRVGRRKTRLVVVGQDAVDLKTGHAEGAQDVVVRGDAVAVSVSSGHGQQDAFLLDTGERAVLEKDGAGDLGLGLDHPRQGGLGPEEVRQEAEGVLEGSEWPERFRYSPFREIAHGPLNPRSDGGPRILPVSTQRGRWYVLEYASQDISHD